MKIFNTMTRQKEEFVPIEPGKVRLYACGPTVYNFIHIGNARPICIFDVLRRYLEWRGYDVTFVQNFTDIDDKIIRRANEEGTTYRDVAEKYIAEYRTDAEGLGVRPATVHPRATENMDAIITLVTALIDKGYAYRAENGDVYFRTKSFPEYGKLSTIWRAARASPWASRRRIRWTSPCGRRRSPASRRGRRRGATGAPAGTSNAPPWRGAIWAKRSTSTAAGRI